jgi:ferredoxin
MPDQHHHQTLPLAFSSASAAASLGWAAERCIRSAPNHLECQRCVETCPAQALFFVEENERSAKGQRLVVSDACHGCGACLPSCPTEALLSSELQRLDQALATQQQGKPLTIACHRVESAKPTTESLHCLRIIGVDQLLNWMTQTPGQSITLCVADDCAHCQAAPTKQANTDTWWEQMQGLDVLQLAETHRPYRAAQGAVMSRRRFMGASRPQQPVYTQDDAGVRARRLQRYAAAVQSGFSGDFSADLKQLPRIQLDQQRCDASGVCSKICPTDALKLTDQGVLSFTSLDCISCGFCISHCPEQALVMTDSSDFGTWVLRENPVVACFDCGREFSSPRLDSDATPICPACRREKNLLQEGFSQLFG